MDSHYPLYLRSCGSPHCEVPTDWKRGNITPIFKKGKKGRPRELQASQSHLCAQQHHGADPPGNYAEARGK